MQSKPRSRELSDRRFTCRHPGGRNFLSFLCYKSAGGRLLFAFARDRLIVGHKVWSRISVEIEGSDCGIDCLRCDVRHHRNRRIFEDGCANRHCQLRSDWDLYRVSGSFLVC